MANTLLLRRRIKTAQNVSKTTRAMQMIAASKLKKAQNAALSSRPYVEKLSEVSRTVTSQFSDPLHPYMSPIITSEKTLLIAITPDKGLCGGLITNLIREYLRHNKNDTYYFITIGKKIERVAARSKDQLIASFPFGTTLPTFDKVYPILNIVNEYYLSGKVDKVKILYSKFNSFFTQVPYVVDLLPVAIESEKKESNYQLFEPSAQELLPSLLTHYIEMSLYQLLLENYLSEQASRMLAMQNATNNAKDIIEELKLEYNKARQERITKEILDITGAAALLYEE